MAETANMQSPEMRYLLGTLSEDEKIRMEEAFFADDSQFEAVEIAEDALVDSYLADELSTKDREQFESKLRNSPRLVERVHFARALAERASKLVAPEEVTRVAPAIPLPPAKVRWWERWVNLQPEPRLAFTTCALLLVVTGTVLIPSVLRLRNESDRIAAERAALQRQKEDLERQLSEQRTKSEQLTVEVQRLKDQRAEDLELIEKAQALSKQKESEGHQPLISFATVFLTPSTLRSGGGDPSELVIQPGATTAQLQLALGKTDYRAFNAVLSTAGGTVITRRNRLRPSVGDSGPQLVFSMPTRLLTRDTYIVHLDGVTATGQVENFNDYQFQVTKK